jgi:endonuclease/exonuclease/phosphatase family metal-dependent hydrolase
MQLRVLSLNIHKGIAAHRPRLILSQLKMVLQQEDADILLLQEVVGRTSR